MRPTTYLLKTQRIHSHTLPRSKRSSRDLDPNHLQWPTTD